MKLAVCSEYGRLG